MEIVKQLLNNARNLGIISHFTLQAPEKAFLPSLVWLQLDYLLRRDLLIIGNFTQAPLYIATKYKHIFTKQLRQPIREIHDVIIKIRRKTFLLHRLFTTKIYVIGSKSHSITFDTIIKGYSRYTDPVSA